MLKILSTLKNIPKKILIPTTVISAVVLFVALAIFNLEKTVEVSTGLFFNFKVKTESIKFKNHKIFAKNIELYGKDNDLMIAIPEANASYESLFKRKVDDITANNALVFVRRNKNGEINFVKTFSKKSTPKNKEEVMKNYKPHIYKFANTVSIDNVEINYEDLNYSKPIRKKLNISGKLKFNKKNALEIFAKTKNNKTDTNYIEYSFSNETEPYSMKIKTHKLNFGEEWNQYLGNNTKLHCSNTNINSDLKISYLGYFGNLNLKNKFLSYDDYEENIKNLNIDVLFDKYNIKLNADYNIFNNKEKINLTYTDKELKILTSLKNINSYKILKYKPIQNKNLDLSQINIKNIDLKYTYSKEKESILNINSDLNNSKFKNIIFKDLKLNYSANKNKEKKLENSYLLLNIFGVDEKINFNMISNKENFYDFSLKTFAKNNDNLIPNLNSKIKVENQKDKVNLDFSSNLINFNGSYAKQENLLKLIGENFNFDFDNKNKFISLKANFSKNLKNKNSKLDFYYNLKNKNFNLDYDISKFSLRKKYKKDDINFDFSGKGYIHRKNNILTSNGNISNLNLKYKANLENLSGVYFTKKEYGKSVSEFHGELGNISYSNYNLSALKIDLGLRENILNIFDIENEKVFIGGDIKLKEKNINLDFNINNLNNEDIGLSKLSFNLGSLKGSLLGDFKNPNSEISFENLEIDAKKYGKINSLGNLFLKDKKINISNLKIGDNKFTGTYDINSGEYQGKLNLFEENILKYSSLNKLKARLISQVDISGIFSKEEKDFNADITGNIDRIFYISKELPNIYFKANYNDFGNFVDGLLDISEISILDDKRKKLLSLDGYIDLGKKFLDISSENSIQKINLSSLSKYTDINFIKGTVLTDFQISGNLKNPNYNLVLESYDTKIKDVPLNKIKILLDGNFEELSLKNLDIDYAENMFYANGKYNLKNKAYSLNLKSNKLDFIVLNKFLKDKNIRDLSGNAELNFKLNNNNKSTGFIKVSDINLDIPKYKFKISKLNSNITLKNQKINIDYIKSKMNEGIFRASGYIDIPNRLSDFNKNIFKTSNYSIKTSLDNFNHNFPKVSDISLHSNILLSNKRIEGAIYLDKGTIYDIPNNYKSIWKIISSFLFKKVKKKNKDKVEYQLPDYLKDLPYLNLAVILNNPLVLNMDNFTTFVDEVKGDIYVNINLKGENGKFYLLGSGDVENGYIVLNSNKFILEKALVSFNKKNLFLPLFNPNIHLESKVDINGEDTRFGVSGTLKKLRFNITSRNGSSNGDINSLIKDIKTGKVQTEVNTPYYNLLKSLIANQLAQTIFGSSTQTIKKIFHLSKLRLKSDITTSNINEREYFAKSKGNSVESFNISTILEVEQDLYKNKIFANASTKLFSTNTNLNDRFTKVNNSRTKDYDMNLEYRPQNYSIGIGVGSIPQKYRTEPDKNYNNKNYHIDFKFRKKFNYFSELFSF